jgi:hypothetical protein
MPTPAEHYQASLRPFPAPRPPIEYGSNDIVRKVSDGGWLRFKGQAFRVSKALTGDPLALRPQTEQDGCFDLFFFTRKSIRLTSFQ